MIKTMPVITAIDKRGWEVNDRYRDSRQTNVVFIDRVSTSLRETITMESTFIHSPDLVQTTMPASNDNQDNKVYGANMGPIWGRQDPGGPHVDPMNLVIWEALHSVTMVLMILSKHVQSIMLG